MLQGTHSGQLFSDLFSDLVFLSNSCEGSNWTVEDLEELPVVEQIPILHRLDHSVSVQRVAHLGARAVTRIFDVIVPPPTNNTGLPI